jgi:hypothetical protein
MEQGRKLLAGVVTAGLVFALTAQAAFAGADVDDDGDTDMERAAIAVVVVLIVGMVWFFVFRGKEDDTGTDERVPEDR